MIHVEKEVDFKLLNVTSSVFKEDEFIPVRYTCDGVNVSPPIDIQGVPIEAKCLAVIFEDPDAPINTWIHWLVWNIPLTHHLKEDSIKGKQGLNDFGKHYYCGPCPLNGTHRYVFKVYALDTLLILPGNTKKLDLLKAMSPHIVAYGEVSGLYKKITN